MNNDTYLGDSLYASFDGYYIRLYASDGRSTTDEVYLHGNVLVAFLRFAEQVKEESR
jgi:hypothetical protein